MKKIKKDMNHRNIVPAGGFVKNIGRRGIMIAAGAILLAAGLIVCLSLKKESNPRSEERRVGKECRSRWSPYH